MLSLISSADHKAPEQDDGNRLVGRQPAHGARRRSARHHRAGRESVVADYLWIRFGRDEHARAAAALTLEGVLEQPLIERAHPRLKALDAMPRLKRNGTLKAHVLVVE